MTTLPLVYDIVLAGRGGQGVIYLSRILGTAALLQGLGVRTTETHGMAMRGGSVQCFVRIGDTHGPLFPSGSASLLMALHAGETSRALPLVGKGGTVLVNGSERTAGAAEGAGGTVLYLDADAIAVRHGNLRSANLALLGGAVTMVEGFPLEAGSLEAAIAGSGPDWVARKNLGVFREGMERAELRIES